MAQTFASTVALETSGPVGPPSSGLSPDQRSKHLGKRYFLVTVALLLFASVVSLSVLAKDGLYYPQSSTAHRISKASKMSQHQIPELGNERQEFVPAFPGVSGDINEGLQLTDGQQTIVSRDAAVLACPPLRSPPRH
jgi:hypothetical protein